jgi:hypothetical protein
VTVQEEADIRSVERQGIAGHVHLPRKGHDQRRGEAKGHVDSCLEVRTGVQRQVVASLFARSSPNAAGSRSSAALTLSIKMITIRTGFRCDHCQNLP